MAQRPPAGKAVPPQMVGLFRPQIPDRRLCEPALGRCVRRGGHTGRTLCQPGAAAHPALAAGRSAAHSFVVQHGGALAGYSLESMHHFGPAAAAAPGRNRSQPAGAPYTALDASDRSLYRKSFAALLPYFEKSRREAPHRNRCVCARVLLFQAVLAVCDRGFSGRYHRNHFLPRSRRRVDEPQQSGVGALQHCMGSGHCHGHAAFV